MPSMFSEAPDLDVLIVGTGFSGIYLLHHLRKLHFNVKAITASSELGGVWNHNTYPGSRVDIEVPTYELDIEELWNHPEGGWVWSERFPGRDELQKYFRFVDKRLDLSRDCVFDTWIDSAAWDDEERKWKVRASDGRTWTARFFIPCVGYAAKPLIPRIKGLDDFQGQWTHTASWPKEGIDLEGKRVGVVGTGASGVQVIQTIASIVKNLTVFQRTPATAIPMQQRPLRPEESTRSSLSEKSKFFTHRKSQWDGAKGCPVPRSAKGDSPSQRQTEWSRLWNEGGFAFWTSNYMDTFSDQESNDLIYEEWKQRVRERIHDPQNQELLAPSQQPYAFGTKRIPLEEKFYESFNLPHVDLINLHSTPILKATTSGLLLLLQNPTPSTITIPLDILILATGFDISLGPLLQMSIRGTSSLSLSQKWAPTSPLRTYLGLSLSSFPNLLFPYGPQSPSNTCNGPVCAEIQGSFILDLLVFMRDTGKTRFEPEQDAETMYSDLVRSFLKESLFEGTQSYYWGDNLLGDSSDDDDDEEEAQLHHLHEENNNKHDKKSESTISPHKPTRTKRIREPLFWFAGLPAYIEKLEEVKRDGWKGFQFE
ncbi:putative cyclopentanonemonooxygenase [Phaeomoniella chlamydospora]|uniref:L-ornithine N(5)-monooxygenase n=1 Tax=Phaeomoniella chlamydospora TaxID=158046 RepID=A0A0G2HGN3_PHACM|nr:putative cyclopentanonemonooxygenase [Phaeomoniella chlamydospora]